MANQNAAILSSSLVIFVISLSLAATVSNADSTCRGPCQTLCDDGTANCNGGGSPSGECLPSGRFVCSESSFPIYTCSPPETEPSTPALLTNNDFMKGGDGGDPSDCDEAFHDNSERVVALSTGWYAGGSRCGATVTITAANGMSTTAKVVDECDSTRGCDAEHDGQEPCRNNIVDGSDAVWSALGLDKGEGEVDVTWSIA